MKLTDDLKDSICKIMDYLEINCTINNISKDNKIFQINGFYVYSNLILAYYDEDEKELHISFSYLCYPDIAGKLIQEIYDKKYDIVVKILKNNFTYNHKILFGDDAEKNYRLWLEDVLIGEMKNQQFYLNILEKAEIYGEC